MERYWSFLRASFAEVARCSSEEGHDEWQGQWFLHYDTAPSHTLLAEQQFLAENKHPCHHPTTLL
jgi:hypothetical protein